MIVVAKIGTSSITDEHGEITRGAIAKLCREVAAVSRAGHRVVVVSSGAIGAGLPALGFGGATRPRDAVTLQAIAAVGQSRLMQVYGDELGGHGLVAGQVLIAPLDFMERRQYLQARGTLARLLELGVIPIVNENDAIADDEIRFGDNDRLAALVAHLVDADVLVLLTDTAGVAHRRPTARLECFVDRGDRRSRPRSSNRSPGERGPFAAVAAWHRSWPRPRSQRGPACAP